MTRTSPTLARDIDLFTDDALADPWPFYRQIRDTASAVFLEAHGVWALGRYDDVRAALMDWESFSSAQGVSLNPSANTTTKGIVVATDPPDHTALRGVLAERLAPRALRRMQADLEQRARELVEPLVAGGSFDAVDDLARAFPVRVVLRLVGLDESIAPRALEWAEAAFNAGGPDVARTRAAYPLLEDQFAYLASLHKGDLAEDSFGWAIFDAADHGVIGQESIVPLMSAYVTAGLDTTINAISAAVRYFSEHPDQWEMIRADRSLIPAAFNETIRMESPLQWFARVTTRDIVYDDAVIPEGSRVLMLYGSANHDERKWDDPDRFDITRNAAEHLGFGMGIHGCAGQGLARMEGHAVIKALADLVERFETGAPERRLNNRIRGLAHLPTTVVRA